MPVTASSTEGRFRAETAVDGKAITRWSSTWSDPEWIRVDLGSTAAISHVVLDWENHATDYRVQLSDDGVTWRTLCAVASGSGTESCNGSGTGRYVRMYGNSRANGYGYSLWEFQGFGGRP
ncbi:discoidin domain-containing protein [Streptomyces sp. NPDC098781]|uniref:discoidin domain-containing protein n=1 Tax=Streptomyces sp. NPDC098781 TaxID=3366097 RepID=UPI00380F45E3